MLSSTFLDEAGFLSVHQMLELQEFAIEHECRLVVTGDTKQHHSVQWGDALRILERSGAITQAVLSKIHRQRIPELREAIEDLSKGRTGEGFDKLDEFGVIQEIADDSGRLAAIAGKVTSSRRKRTPPLSNVPVMVSPTRRLTRSGRRLADPKARRKHAERRERVLRPTSAGHRAIP
jgi:hypothetical protein